MEIRTLGLTKKQKAVFDFIDGYITKQGHSPTVHDIATYLDCSDTNAHRYVKQLKARGAIDFKQGTRQSITINQGD